MKKVCNKCGEEKILEEDSFVVYAEERTEKEM